MIPNNNMCAEGSCEDVTVKPKLVWRKPRIIDLSISKTNFGPNPTLLEGTGYGSHS